MRQRRVFGDWRLEVPKYCAITEFMLRRKKSFVSVSCDTELVNHTLQIQKFIRVQTTALLRLCSVLKLSKIEMKMVSF